MDTDCASERTGKQMLRECPYTACWGKALQAENARLKALLSHSFTKLEYDELQAEIAKLQLITGAIEENCWDLRCIDIPTGGGDSDIGWIVVEHNQAEPKERTIGRGKTPAEAIEQALKG